MKPADARPMIEAALAEPPGSTGPARARFEREWSLVLGRCAQDPAARAALADLAPALAARDDDLEGAHWLAILLRVLHEEPFVALEPVTGRGIAGRMSGVADTFQLHTLLMAAWPPARSGLLRRPRPLVSAAVADNARGEGPQALDVEVVGAWNLQTHAALDRDGRLPAPDTRDTATWIWNEGVPADIPAFDGHRVILLGPAPYARTWPATRVFDGLPATLDERLLEPAEVERWLRAIAAA